MDRAALPVSLWLLMLAVPAIAYACVLGWLLLGRPGRPRAGPPVAELGTEPPAVVALILSRWRVDETAFVATLLDLAARRYLEISEPGGEILVRPGRLDPRDLLPPEREVYDLVGSRTLPGRAVRLGALVPDGAELRDVRIRFRKAVLALARDLGLSTRKPREAVESSLALFGLLAAVNGAIASAIWFPDARFFLAAPIIWLMLSGVFLAPVNAATMRHEWSTAEGRRAATYWLGVKAFLDGYRTFHDLPAASVAVWDRYLAYAAAVGSATRATSTLAVVWTGRPGAPGPDWSGPPGGADPGQLLSDLKTPKALRIGVITVYDDKVVTPAGTWPRASTRWTVTETSRRRLRVDPFSVVFCIGMTCIFPLNILYVLLTIERRPVGAVCVTASWLGTTSCVTDLPFDGDEELAAIRKAVTAAVAPAPAPPGPARPPGRRPFRRPRR